jgi:hypothetical protein
MTQPEQATVLILISPELLKNLGEWSDPVQVRVIKTTEYPGWTMEARTPEVSE